jgi:hypothetical protein
MNLVFRIIFCLFFFNQVLVTSLCAQKWNFEKQEDGIKVYTRNEANTSLKSYRGETTFRAPMEKVCSLIGNGKNFDWWGPDITNIRVIVYQPNKYVQYYFIYDLPWPVTDRDLVVDARIKIDTVTGEFSVVSRPLLKTVPEKPDLVRISRYWQKWTIKPLDKGNIKVTLEGFVDPGGNVPAWIYNMFTTEMPLRTMRLLRERALSPKPINK